MKGILLNPSFLLKCIAWVFCFVTIVLLNAIPYWSVHKKKDVITLYEEHKGRELYQYVNESDLPPVNVELENGAELGAQLGHEYHVITTTSSTYLLMLSVFIILYLVDRPPKYQMLIMLFVGAVLNIVASILEFIKHSDYSKLYHENYGQYGFEHPDVLKPFNMVVLGMMLLFAGLTMCVDFILYFVLNKNEDEAVSEE